MTLKLTTTGVVLPKEILQRLRVDRDAHRHRADSLQPGVRRPDRGGRARDARRPRRATEATRVFLRVGRASGESWAPRISRTSRSGASRSTILTHTSGPSFVP